MGEGREGKEGEDKGRDRKERRKAGSRRNRIGGMFRMKEKCVTETKAEDKFGGGKSSK